MLKAIAGRGRPCQAQQRRERPAALLAFLLLAAVAPCAALPASPRNQARTVARTPPEALRYVMDVTLDPLADSLRATADVTLRCTMNSSSLEFALNRALNITAVRDSRGNTLAATRTTLMDSPRFAVQLSQPCVRGGTIGLHFEYAGALHPQPPFAATRDFLLLRDDDAWYPQAGVFDFTVNDLTLRVPSAFEARTTGSLAEQRQEGSTAVYRGKTAHAVNGRTVVVYRLPARSSVAQEVQLPPGPGNAAAAPPPVHLEEICGDAVAALPASPRCGEMARRAAPILQRFAAMLGPPPENSLTILAGPSASNTAIGYSAPGLLVVNDWAAQFAGVSGYAPEFLAHEISHQWFPNGVAPASASDGWLAESLAEYLAWRYLLDEDPEAARVMVAEAMRDSIAYTPMRPLSRGLDLLGGPWSAARATLYQRGMLVFRTLETVIDRERVDRVLSEFYKRYTGHKASIADFRAVCEEISGRNLGWFFDYFLQGTRIPTIELRRLPSESPGVAAGEIVVKDFPPEGSVRVEMAVRTAQGIVEHSVATRGAVTPFTVNVPAPALAITLDPDLRILRWTEPAERSKLQSAILAALPDPLTTNDLPAAIGLYRRALAADPGDASRRAQSLHERLGELESAHQEWDAALMDLDAAVNGHSLSIYETYLCRAKAYVYRGYLHLRQGRKQEALGDASAGLALPDFVLLQHVPLAAVDSPGDQQLLQSLKIIRDRAAQK